MDPKIPYEKSDVLSHIIDHDDWAISEHFFYFLEHIWGPYSIDKFDDHLNCKMPKILGSRF